MWDSVDESFSVMEMMDDKGWEVSETCYIDQELKTGMLITMFYLKVSKFVEQPKHKEYFETISVSIQKFLKMAKRKTEKLQLWIPELLRKYSYGELAVKAVSIASFWRKQQYSTSTNQAYIFWQLEVGIRL
ncbi:MAG: hypothetical protein ACLUUO_09440 [Sellimonas intestinalis]